MDVENLAKALFAMQRKPLEFEWEKQSQSVKEYWMAEVVSADPESTGWLEWLFAEMDKPGWNKEVAAWNSR